MRILCLLLIAFSISLIHAQDFPSTVGYKVANITSYTKVATSNQTTLYNVVVNGYDPIIQLIDVRGATRFQMGYDYAALLGKDIIQIGNSLFSSLISNKLELDGVFFFLDWQWNWFLSKHVPQEYLDEIKGMKASAEVQRIGEIDKYVSRIVVVSNFPGNVEDLKYVLENELTFDSNDMFSSLVDLRLKKFLQSQRFRQLIVDLAIRWRSQCSNWAAWGSRTVNGELFSFRNLDWQKDTGMSQKKLISIFHPPGKIAHATFGWTGMLGAITGISAKGVTAHEANLEEKLETFKGFPFVLRLRYIMENAANLKEVIQLWNSTLNTVGFIHMFSSAADRKAVAIETMAGYDAYFFDNDPREKNATVYNSATNTSSQIGYPLVDAVYRSNNGFDPVIRQNFLWGQNFSTNPEGSENRYFTEYQSTKYYSDNKVQIGIAQVINITAIIAQKGKEVYQCQNTDSGSNVLSVSYMPERLFAYAAWENGSGNNWRPACCNTYVGIDLTKWFA